MDCAAGPFLRSLRYPSGINPLATGARHKPSALLYRRKKTRRSGFFPRPLSTPCRQRSLLWSIIRDPETLPVSQLMGVDYAVDPIGNSRKSYHRV
ncbi:hypothetical protein EMIT093MI4_10707 [Pseudomonas sp. IT-93MI4]